MKEKKNIENFFQDKFKDFEVAPDEHIWANIEEKLKEKKRRVIPFWWKLSGIAASLLIGFLITNALFFSNQIRENNVVIQEKKSTKIEKNKSGNSINKNQAVVATQVTSSNDKSNQNNLSQSISNSTLNNSEKNMQRIVYSPKKNKDNSAINKIKSKKQESFIPKNNDSDVANHQMATSNLDEKEPVQHKDNSVQNNLEKAIVNNEKELIKTGGEPKNTIENKTQNTTNQIVAENKIIDIKNIDTTKIAVVANALEELLKEKEKESKKKAESKLNRWQVATTVAPIYFSSTSGGSPLDSKFVSNDKNYEPSFSYGLGVNYALNKKWNIRTGVNSLAFEYNTNDVVFFQNTNASQIQNVKSNLQGSLIEIQNKNSVTSPEVGLNSAVIEKFDGSINQKMGYLEIPLEMSYQIIDKKLGVQITSGFSSLILNQNSVAVQSNGQIITIGEATNLNKIHFSGNVGFGVRYRFLKSFNANVNPMFKYQINTFSNDSGNFKPYMFGLYTGVSYTF